jgi:hypothetical protein
LINYLENGTVHLVNTKDEQRQDDRKDDYNDGVVDQLFLSRPGHLLHLTVYTVKKCSDTIHGIDSDDSGLVARVEGLEPPTNGFGDHYSAN